VILLRNTGRLALLSAVTACICLGQLSITVPAGTASLERFIASHNGYKIQIPPGTYVLNNSRGKSGITLHNFTGELNFAVGARLLCTAYSSSAGWCVNIQHAKGLVIRNIWVGYMGKITRMLLRTEAVTGALQVWDSENVSVYRPHVDASTGIGFVLGNSRTVHVFDAEVLNTAADGLSFVNDAEGYLNGLYARRTGDDSLSVLNYEFYPNNTGFIGTNIRSYASNARGISVPGQSEVKISDFYVQDSVKAGIITQTDFSFHTRRPKNVTWSNGRIANSGLFGIQTDAADHVSYNNIHVASSASGGWYGCDVPCTDISVSALSVIGGTGGSALYAGAISHGRFSDVFVADNPTYGVFVTKSADLSFTNLRVTNVSKSDPLGRAWWAERNTGMILVEGLTLIDNQIAPTGIVVGEFKNPENKVRVTNLASWISAGKIRIQSTSLGALFRPVE
jgi:hypothetical protein